ncbi:hypothetical protein AVEN_163649-1, partial [Araneus ventricosus]
MLIVPFYFDKGRGDLVVRSRLRVQRVAGLKPDFNMFAVLLYAKTQRHGSNAFPTVWCGKLERGCKLRRHLAVVQNGE